MLAGSSSPTSRTWSAARDRTFSSWPTRPVSMAPSTAGGVQPARLFGLHDPGLSQPGPESGHRRRVCPEHPGREWTAVVLELDVGRVSPVAIAGPQCDELRRRLHGPL